MSIRRITKDDVIRTRMRRRYGTEDVDQSPTLIPSQVIQITNTDDLLRELKIATGGSLATTAGWNTLMTVPNNKRWTVYDIYASRMSGTTTNVTDVGISDGTSNFIIHNQTAASQSFVTAGLPIPVKQGWTFVIYTTGGTDNWQIWAIIDEEDNY